MGSYRSENVAVTGKVLESGKTDFCYLPYVLKLILFLTEHSVLGKLTTERMSHFESSVSSVGTEPQCSSISAHRAVLSDQQPGTDCTATVTMETEAGVLSNATTKNFNRSKCSPVLKNQQFPN